MQTEPIQYGTIAMGLLGGLALFLYGMDNLTSALKSVSGPRMRELLSRLTHNRFQGVFTGAFTTAVIQSSSVTTVLVVGFVAAGLMRLEQSIGIIMGAGIGTTITAQIIAFKITKFALAAVAVGFALYFISGREIVRKYGSEKLVAGIKALVKPTRDIENREILMKIFRKMDHIVGQYTHEYHRLEN